jgi:autotransporter-associated beta strand protein
MKMTYSMAVLWLIGAGQSFAATPAAKVTQSFGKISCTTSPSAKSESAASGTALSDGESLKTGKASLAELELANKTITRLGPETVFQFSGAKGEADLQSGTMLFSKPKDGQELTIKMAGVTAAVTGTTGFVEKEGNNVVLGVIEGTIHVSVGTATAVIKAGKMLVATGLNAQVVSFDVPNFVKTSPFFSRFQGQLPNEKYITHEIAEYTNLVARGFIAPVKVATPDANRPGPVAANKSARRDSEGNPTNASAAAGTTVASVGGHGGSTSTSGGFTVSGATLNMGNSSSASSMTLSALGSGTTRISGGTIQLAGANTYSGATTVGSGALAVNGAEPTPAG